MRDRHRFRLYIDLTEENYIGLDKITDYGEKRTLINSLIAAAIEAYEEYGKIAVYALMSRKTEILETFCTKE